MLIKWLYWRKCIEPLETINFLLHFEMEVVKDVGIIMT